MVAEALKVWAAALGAVTLVNLVSLSGAAFSLAGPEKLHKRLHLLVSLAVGALFGDAFIHLLPQSYPEHGNPLAVSLLVIGGILAFHGVERFFLSREARPGGAAPGLKPFVALNLVGDAIHNFIDGILIGASFSVNLFLGITTTLAVLLHEIPQEFGDFGVLLYGGLSWRKALLFNFLVSLTATAGVVVSLLLGPLISGYAQALLPVTAGGFIYLAGSTLIPEIRRDNTFPRPLMDMAAILTGVLAMALLRVFEK